jgi:hypothetical protein
MGLFYRLPDQPEQNVAARLPRLHDGLMVRSATWKYHVRFWLAMAPGVDYYAG